MKGVNDVVKWLCGMALVIAALVVLAMFLTDYSRADRQVSAAQSR